MNWQHANSGTYATDCYRESMANGAMNVLLAGKGNNPVSGTHLNANELCIECIVRLGADDKQHVSDAAKLDVANKAVNNLRLGNGYHKKQSDHSGGNTCASVIANATT